MRRVLITGSKGFVGKMLVQKLKALSCQVYEFDQKQGLDILKKNDFIKFKKIDTVFHLAGIVGYEEVSRNPLLAYKINVCGTINVLDFCREKKAKLIFPSTYVYGPPFGKSKKENDCACPTNLYTHSKFMAELFCQAYAKKYQLNVVIARTSNAYGPNQPKQYIIPFLLEALKKNKKIELTHPLATRDFIYISDLTNAWIKLAQTKTQPGDIYNVSFGKTTTLKKLVILLKNLTGSKSKVNYSKKTRNNEVLQSLLDNSKIKRKTGWKPKISLEEGLKRIIIYSNKVSDK